MQLTMAIGGKRWQETRRSASRSAKVRGRRIKSQSAGEDDEVVDAAGSPAAEQVHPAEARAHVLKRRTNQHATIWDR